MPHHAIAAGAVDDIERNVKLLLKHRCELTRVGIRGTARSPRHDDAYWPLRLPVAGRVSGRSPCRRSKRDRRHNCPFHDFSLPRFAGLNPLLQREA